MGGRAAGGARDESSPGSTWLLALAFALLLVAGVAAVFLVGRTVQANREVARAFEVRQLTATLSSELNDAETGQRGYLLTQHAEYLDPFHRALATIPSTFARLRTLAGPEEEKTLDRSLKPLIDAKLAELSKTVRLAQTGNRARALALVDSGLGQQLMEKSRAEFTALGNRELDRLRAREEAVGRLQSILFALVGMTLAAAIVLAGFSIQSMMRAVGALKARTVELEQEARLRRETEEVLRQSQKMEATGQLAGGIAHDFNNLLTVILGNYDSMRRRLDALPPSDAERLRPLFARPIDLGLQASRSAAQLTQRLLAFSRRQPLEPVRLDLNRLISGMSEMLRRSLGEPVKIETVLAAGLWPTLADANQVENALLNLCNNARDAMDEGGSLTIETGNAFLDEIYTEQFPGVAPGQYVLLSVSDTGVGIAPDMIGKVFDPFFTTRKSAERTGLGLAMVHGFVRQSGGHVRIYSEVGHGTTVKIYLPRLTGADAEKAAPEARSAEVTSAPRARNGECILVVEDTDGVREYAVSSLEELGYGVLSAPTAERALDIVEKAPKFDLLFTDVVLPGMSGRELADRLSKSRPGIPVLFTTGYSRNAIVHNGRLDPGVNLLSKPYTQRTLASRIRELIDRSSPGRQL